MACIFSRCFLFLICLQLKGNNQASVLHLVVSLLCVFAFSPVCFLFLRRYKTSASAYIEILTKYIYASK